MDFEDFIENKHSHKRERYHHSQRQDFEYPEYYQTTHGSHINWIKFQTLLRKNKKLRILILIGGSFLILLFILLLITFLPALKNIIKYILDNGLKGVWQEIISILAKISK